MEGSGSVSNSNTAVINNQLGVINENLDENVRHSFVGDDNDDAQIETPDLN